MPQLDFTTFSSQIFWLIFFYTILYLFVSNFVVPKLGKILEERDSIILGHSARLERIKAETKKFETEYLSSLNHAFKSSSLRISQLRSQIDANIYSEKARKELEIKTLLEENNQKLNSFRKGADRVILEISVDITKNILKNIAGEVKDENSIKDKLLEEKFALTQNKS
jgi:F-type H+-transporting ATPase subunit b